MNEVAPTNTIESNLKYALGIYLNYYSQGNDPDSLIKAEMTSIAHQHSFYGGEGVYILRSLLHIVIHDVLPQQKKADVHLSSSAHNFFSGAMYPNPTSGNATYMCTLNENEKGEITITNAIGSILLYKQINSNQTLLETGLLPSGVYYYLVICKNEIKDKGKVVINR
jgi:hypothetical protein